MRESKARKIYQISFQINKIIIYITNNHVVYSTLSMVTENSSSVITLTPCTIIKLYHEDFFEHKKLSSTISSCLQEQFSRFKWLHRLFILPMALVTSMRLPADEKSANILSSSPIPSSAMMNNNNNNLTKLYKYSQETEMKSYVDQNGSIRQYRQSTERALLAQRKIFLRKKLGEGSFSSVREGFDTFHQHKVAIKVKQKLFLVFVFSLNELIRLLILNELQKIFKRNFYRGNWISGHVLIMRILLKCTIILLNVEKFLW